MVNSLVARGGCGQTVARPPAGAGKLAGYLKKNRTRQTGQASLTAPAGAGKLAGYLKKPYPANLAGVPDAPRPRKASKRAAGDFRGVGKRQNTPLNVSEASESIKTRR